MSAEVDLERVLAQRSSTHHHPLGRLPEAPSVGARPPVACGPLRGLGGADRHSRGVAADEYTMPPMGNAERLRHLGWAADLVVSPNRDG